MSSYSLEPSQEDMGECRLGLRCQLIANKREEKLDDQSPGGRPSEESRGLKGGDEEIIR